MTKDKLDITNMTKDKLDTGLETKEGEPVLKFTNLWNFLIYPASGFEVWG